MQPDDMGASMISADPIAGAAEDADDYHSESPDDRQPLTRDVPEAEPFPVETLGPLAPAAAAIQEHTQAPMAICGQSVLAAACVAVQGHANVVMPYGGVRPTTLFLMTVAESGERKSAVDSLALKPIKEVEHENLDTYRADLLRYQADKAVWDAKRSAALSQIKAGRKGEAKIDNAAAEEDLTKLAAEEPTMPLNPMILCSDPTIEGYYKLTECGQPSMGLFTAEGGTFAGGYGMKPDHKLKTGSALSDLWDGEAIKRARVGDGMMFLRDRRLAFHILVQPEPAALLLGDEMLVGQGFLSRMLVSAPPPMSGHRTRWVPTLEAVANLTAYHQRLAGLMRRQPQLREDAINELDPRRLTLEPDAAQLLNAFYDWVEPKQAADCELSPIRGFASKAVEHAARIAAVLTLFDNIDAEEVPAEMMAGGVALARYYLAEALRLKSWAIIDPHLELCQQVWDWIMTSYAEPAIYPAAVYQRGPYRARDKAKTLAIFETLADHGYLRPIKDGAQAEGRHRKPAWLIRREPA